MLTKADFQQAIKDSIANYPAVAPLYQAGDPRILQHLDAMATMLAMVSAQVETVMLEPFDKTRDSTILADAAMRGIIRKATPARVRITAKNEGTADVVIDSGREITDANGNAWRVEVGGTVPAGGTLDIEAVQLKAVQIAHTVQNSQPFYAIAIPDSDDAGALCGVSVADETGDFTFREEYVNSLPGDRIFHVEADDQQRLYVRFGFDGVVGVQPRNGAALTVTVNYSHGKVRVDAGSPFSFAYIGSPNESRVTLSLAAMMIEGQDPLPMSVLRDLAKYPSIYQTGAVFLGEFDFLVRRNFPSLQFLSVWNEAVEEDARGASVRNINTIFVSCVSPTRDELSQESNGRVHERNLTETQKAIRTLIKQADSSYKVAFFYPDVRPISIAVQASVSTAYIASDVAAKIRETLLAEFGKDSEAAKHGRARPLYKRIYEILRQRVPALAHGGSDLVVNISDDAGFKQMPEMWRYVSAESLNVSVKTANLVNSSWGF